jgi:hypothetical protein
MYITVVVAAAVAMVVAAVLKITIPGVFGLFKEAV